MQGWDRNAPAGSAITEHGEGGRTDPPAAHTDRPDRAFHRSAPQPARMPSGKLYQPTRMLDNLGHRPAAERTGQLSPAVGAAGELLLLRNLLVTDGDRKNNRPLSLQTDRSPPPVGKCRSQNCIAANQHADRASYLWAVCRHSFKNSFTATITKLRHGSIRKLHE